MKLKKECRDYCHLIKSGRRCEVGDPINKAGNADTTTLCIYYPCVDARAQAGTSWLHTNWSESTTPIGNNEPEIQTVLIDDVETHIELAKFETPKQKEAGIFDGYQMYINYSGWIFARSRLDKIIHPIGVNIWESADLY